MGLALNTVQAGRDILALCLASQVSCVQAVTGGMCTVVLPFPVLTDELISCTGGMVPVPTAKQVFQGLEVLKGASEH